MALLNASSVYKPLSYPWVYEMRTLILSFCLLVGCANKISDVNNYTKPLENDRKDSAESSSNKKPASNFDLDHNYAAIKTNVVDEYKESQKYSDYADEHEGIDYRSKRAQREEARKDKERQEAFGKSMEHMRNMQNFKKAQTQ